MPSMPVDNELQYLKEENRRLRDELERQARIAALVFNDKWEKTRDYNDARKKEERTDVDDILSDWRTAQRRYEEFLLGFGTIVLSVSTREMATVLAYIDSLRFQLKEKTHER